MREMWSEDKYKDMELAWGKGFGARAEGFELGLI